MLRGLEAWKYMANFAFNFESLTVYQKAQALNIKIYQLTKLWSKEYLFGLTDQLRRAVLSISLNIAEGSSRTKKDFRHFLIISRGSCFECIPLIQLANKLKLLSDIDYQMLYNEIKHISQMLSKFRSALDD